MSITAKQGLNGKLVEKQKIVGFLSGVNIEAGISAKQMLCGEIVQKQTLEGIVAKKHEIVGNVSGTAKLSGDISISNTIIVDYDEFEGPYEVKPLIESQTLDTKDKLMKEDLIVQAIPYAEVTNTARGITVTIGD